MGPCLFPFMGSSKHFTEKKCIYYSIPAVFYMNTNFCPCRSDVSFGYLHTIIMLIYFMTSTCYPMTNYFSSLYLLECPVSCSFNLLTVSPMFVIVPFYIIIINAVYSINHILVLKIISRLSLYTKQFRFTCFNVLKNMICSLLIWWMKTQQNLCDSSFKLKFVHDW